MDEKQLLNGMHSQNDAVRDRHNNDSEEHFGEKTQEEKYMNANVMVALLILPQIQREKQEVNNS